MIGKAGESLWRKATGPVKWQPVAWKDVHCLWDSAFLFWTQSATGAYRMGNLQMASWKMGWKRLSGWPERRRNTNLRTGSINCRCLWRTHQWKMLKETDENQYYHEIQRLSNEILSENLYRTKIIHRVLPRSCRKRLISSNRIEQ